MPINFNINPYYDDYDREKDFLRILFRPGYAVQARELTQLQTIIQNQMGEFGTGIYREGSIVYGAQSSINNGAKYIVLQEQLDNVDVSLASLASLKGKFIKTRDNATTPIPGFEETRWFVIDYRASSDTTPPLLFCTLVSGTGTLGSELIYLETDESQTAIAEVSSSQQTGIAGGGREGNASTISIDDGVFYINGLFVHNPTQSIVVSSEYDGNHPATCRVGLDITHTIIDEDDDNTLLDPAEGSYNYTAPGGHRYRMNLTLVRKDTYVPSITLTNQEVIDGVSDIDFIELIRLNAGGVDKHVKVPIYSAIGDEMARTVYDLHGNFVVDPFSLDVISNVNSYDEKLTLDIGPGRAYVGGRSFETPIQSLAEIDKAREFDVAESNNIGVQFGNYVITNRHFNLFDVDNQEQVDLLNAQYQLGYSNGAWVSLTTSELTASTAQTAVAVGDILLFTATGGNRWGVIAEIATDTVGDLTWYRLTGTTDISADYSSATLQDWDGSGPIGQTGRDVTIFASDGTTTLFTTSGDSGAAFTNNTIPQWVYENHAKIGTAKVRMVRFSEKDITDFGAGDTVDIKNRTYLYEISIIRSTFDNLETLAVSTLSSNAYDFDASARIAIDGKSNEEENNGTILFEPGINSLIFDLPYENIRSIKSGGLLVSEGGTNDIDYAYQVLYNNITIPNSGSGGVDSAPIVSSDSNNLFYPSGGSVSSTVAQLFYTMTIASGGFTDNNGYAYGPGDNVDLGPTSGVLLSIDLGRPDDAADTLRVAFPATDVVTGAVAPSTGTTFNIITTLNLNNGAEKAKTLATNTYTYETPDLSTNPILSLYTSDVFDIVGIWDSGDANSGITLTDYTVDGGGNLVNSDGGIAFNNLESLFEINNGQKDNYYDYGSLKFIVGSSLPVGQLVVQFRYFQHITSGASGMFTVNSYSDVGYDEIPQFSSATTGQLHELRNVLDFRGRRQDAIITGNLIDTAKANVTSFTDLEGVVLPLPTTTVDVDFSYYLDRRDRLVLTSDQEFKLIKGVSSLRPEYPPEPENALTLFLLDVPAYTFVPEDVLYEYIPQKNYKSRDIADIEVRLNDLEYMTALNSLEGEADALTIQNPDGTLGLKTGMLVDGFNGHQVGDVSNPDHDCSIDFEEGELRPPFETESVAMEFDEEDSNDVMLTGELVTLPYTPEIFVEIPLCSKAINVNPYNIANFVGTMELSPHTDNWIDTEQRPTVNVNIAGENDAFRGILGRLNRRTRNRRLIGGGTQWNNWQTTWTGRTTNTKTSVTSSTWRDPSFTSAASRSIRGRAVIRRTDRITRATTVTTRKQTRTGIRTRWGMKTVKRSLGNKVVDLTILPWMRAKEVFFNISGMKPNTTVFPWFDNTSVATYCKPANTLDIVGTQLTYPNDAIAQERRFLEKEEVLVYDVDDPTTILGRGNIVAGHDGSAGRLVAEGLTSEDTFSTRIVKRTVIQSATVSGKWSPAVGRRHRRRIIRTYNITDILGDDANGNKIIAKTLKVTGIKVRGDLNASSEYIVVRFPNIRRRWFRRWWRRRWWWRFSTNRFLAGRFSGVRAGSVFQTDTNWNATYPSGRNVIAGVFSRNGNQHIRIWINPTGRVNYGPGPMRNFYEIKFQFEATYDIKRTVDDIITEDNPGTQAEIDQIIADNSRVLEVVGTVTSVQDANGTTVTRRPPTARLSGITTASAGDALKTDGSGRLSGVFNLPNEGETGLRFKTGERVFRVLDDPNKADPRDCTTSADATYRATGQKKIMQNTTVTTRVPALIRETVTQTRTVRSATSRITSRQRSSRVVGWYDPVAETILVDAQKHPNGVYITKIDLFFKSKDEAIPVSVQIRPTNNGYPDSALIVPFGKVDIPPADVVLPENPFDAESVLAAPTEVAFPSPVYLEPGEYAVVLLSNSNNYETYITEMGAEILGSSNRITEQPYAGSLFKSQNASTWTAEQTQDLMFRLYKAKFDIGVVGEAILGQYETEDMYPWQVFKSVVETIDPSDATDIKFYYKGTTLVNAEDESLEPEQAIDTAWVEYIPDENVFANREMGAGPEAGTFYFKYTMTSTNQDVSPALDIEPARALLVDQLINDGPISSEEIVLQSVGTGYDPANPPTTSNGGITLTGVGSGFIAEGVISDGTEYEGLYNSGDFMGLRVTNEGSGYYETPTLTIAAGAGEVAPVFVILGETSNLDGNAQARYVTKQVTIPEDRVASDNISVRMRCYRPRGSEIEVYYKVLSAGDDNEFDDTPYVRMTLQQTQTFSEYEGDTFDYEWKPATGTVTYTNLDGVVFNNFVTFAVKVVLFTDSKSRVPYAQDLRILTGST
jgi:hypothetical protein